MRSIRWINSSGPSSLLTSACGALPQPRSRIAFAAETRAAAVASSDRMTPTRTLMAVLVWLRARDRISVTVLGIAMLCFEGPCWKARDKAEAERKAAEE